MSLIGDVIDRAAERIDLEHGLALLAAEDTHGEIERAATGAGGGWRGAFLDARRFDRHGVRYL